jgi:hypothetical protein
MTKAKLCVKKDEWVSAINLCVDTGKDLDTFVMGDGETVFDVLTDEELVGAYYNYVIRDPRDGFVYAVQGCDLDFDL